jgi:hypothetical protein
MVKPILTENDIQSLETYHSWNFSESYVKATF